MGNLLQDRKVFRNERLMHKESKVPKRTGAYEAGMRIRNDLFRIRIRFFFFIRIRI